MSATDLAAIAAVSFCYLFSVLAVAIIVGASVRRMERAVNRMERTVSEARYTLETAVGQVEAVEPDE
jgi:hypothetical protein